MNVQEKLAAIEQHAAKALIEIRELMVELAETDPQNAPPNIAQFAGKEKMRQMKTTARGRGGPTHGGGWVSPLDKSVVWPDDDAA